MQEGTRNGQTIRLLLRQDKRYRSAGHRRPVRRRQNNPQNSLHCGPAGSPERGVSTTHGTSGLGAVAVLERENPGRSHKPSAGLLAPAARPPHRALHRGHRSAAAAPGGDCAAPGRSGWGGGPECPGGGQCRPRAQPRGASAGEDGNSGGRTQQRVHGLEQQKNPAVPRFLSYRRGQRKGRTVKWGQPSTDEGCHLLGSTARGSAPPGHEGARHRNRKPRHPRSRPGCTAAATSGSHRDRARCSPEWRS